MDVEIAPSLGSTGKAAVRELPYPGRLFGDFGLCLIGYAHKYASTSLGMGKELKFLNDVGCPDDGELLLYCTKY